MGEKPRAIPHLSIEVHEENITAGALKILQEIRPDWKAENVEFKVREKSISTN